MLMSVFMFVLGSIVGSFLNVCVWRLPRRESIVVPSSHCIRCNRPIPWYDNIPIISFLALLGRCRFCRSAISVRYFIVELLTAGLFAAAYNAFGMTPRLAEMLIMMSLLVVATFVDLEHQEIPDEVTLGGLAVGLTLSLLIPGAAGSSPWSSFGRSLWGALIGGGLLYIVGFFGEIIFKKEAMGGGDVKLLAMVGSFLGWKLTVLAFFIAPVFGSIVGIFLKFKKGSDIIPYGPHLSLGTLVSCFFGNQILAYLFHGF